jgi:hypothetical protein
VDTLVREGVVGACIPASALVHELLPGSSLVQGFAVVAGGTLCCWHVWVEYHGMQLDAGWKLTTRLVSSELGSDAASKLADGRLSLVEVGERMDADTAEERLALNENVRLLDLYRSDKEAFWAEAPDRLRAVRTELASTSALAAFAPPGRRNRALLFEEADRSLKEEWKNNIGANPDDEGWSMFSEEQQVERYGSALAFWLARIHEGGSATQPPRLNPGLINARRLLSELQVEKLTMIMSSSFSAATIRRINARAGKKD